MTLKPASPTTAAVTWPVSPPPVPIDIRATDIVSQLEPGAAHPRMVDPQTLTASIAISLKRIADKLAKA